MGVCGARPLLNVDQRVCSENAECCLYMKRIDAGVIIDFGVANGCTIGHDVTTRYKQEEQFQRLDLSARSQFEVAKSDNVFRRAVHFARWELRTASVPHERNCHLSGSLQFRLRRSIRCLDG